MQPSTDTEQADWSDWLVGLDVRGFVSQGKEKKLQDMKK